MLGKLVSAGIAGVAIGFALKDFLRDTNKGKTGRSVKTFVSIFERENEEFLLAGMEIVGEETDGRGWYRFFKPDGTFLDVDLSSGRWRIERRKIPT